MLHPVVYTFTQSHSALLLVWYHIPRPLGKERRFIGSSVPNLLPQITVILGVKAYKCLNHPRFLPVILGLFQIASTAMVILDVVTTRGIRRLTGNHYFILFSDA